MLPVEPGAGGETLTPLGRPVMNVHLLPPFFAPAPTLFPLPDLLSLAYARSRCLTDLGDWLSALGAEKPGKKFFFDERSRNVYENKESMDNVPAKKRTFPVDSTTTERHFMLNLRRRVPRAWPFEESGTTLAGILPPPRRSTPAAGSSLVGQGHAENADGAERKRPCPNRELHNDRRSAASPLAQRAGYACP